MKLIFKLKIMKEPELLLQPMNPKSIKILYESLKQNIINLNNIKEKFNSTIKKNNIINSKILINFGNSNFPKKHKMKNMTLKNLEKMIYNRFIKCYQINQDFYNVKVINEIISNEYSHIVSQFKDYLIEDDTNEFIHKLYTKYESIFLLKQIFKYYNIGSVVYPNYILLPEKRYIYKNIKKKQKIIDLQEKENKDKIKEKFVALYENNNEKSNIADGKVFDSKIIDSILNQSNTSNIKNIFYGLSNENSMDFDIKKIYHIVKKINKIEEDNNYFKLIEKNKNSNSNNNNKKVINQNNNDLSNGQIINNNLQVKNIQNIKHFIFNEINQLHKKENNKIQNEQSNIKKINTNNTSDFKLEKLKFDLRNINREGNLYSLCLNKNKVERINNIKNIINSYYNNKNKKNANSLNSILKNKKVNQYSRNHLSNILDSVDNIKMNTINYFIKNDLNNNKNNINLINEKSNIKAKNIIENKEKINKSNKNKLTNINKNIFPKIFSLKEPNQESILDNNNRQIKKSIIDELLSSISSCKETWRNSKLTESNREFSHLSMNISDKGKLPVNNLNLNNQKEFENKTKINISDNFENISKVFNLGKNRKENSSGIDFSCINKENINVHKYHTSHGKKIKKRINKMNSFNVNIKSDINNIKNPVSNKRNREHNRYFSKQIFNSEISTLINKEKSNYSKKDKIINSTNKNNNKDNLLNTNSIINIKKNIHYNFLNSKNSRNIPSSYLYDKNNNNNTLSIIKKSKYININSINNNASNINNIKSFETISSMGSMLQDKTKLNFDSLKLTKFKKQNNNNSNTYKKMCLKKINFNSERNIDNNHLFNRTNKIILNSSINRRQNDLFPLSARISGIIKDESNNLSESVNNLDKSKYRNLKYSLNENNPKTNNYANDIKNKKLNINFVNNNTLTHSTIKEEKKIIKKMKTNIIPELNIRPNNRKRITSNILSLSNGNNTDMNLFKTLNSTVSKFTNSLTKKSNAKINDNFNLKKNNLLKSSNTKNNFKKSGNNTNIGNHYEKINKNTQHYWKHLNINEVQKNKNNKDKNFTNRIGVNDNNKRHYKFNSTQFFMDGSSNFDSLKYYSLNYNSISNKTYQNKAKFLVDTKNNKKGKNFKSNMNKIKDLQIGNKFIFNKSKKKNIFPISITERNRQIHLLSPINRIKENIKNKK